MKITDFLFGVELDHFKDLLLIEKTSAADIHRQAMNLVADEYERKNKAFIAYLKSQAEKQEKDKKKPNAASSPNQKPKKVDISKSPYGKLIKKEFGDTVKFKHILKK